MSAVGWIPAQFGAPANVHAGVTTRAGGISRGSLGELNLAAHVGDDADCVTANRALLRGALALPSEPLWLQQVHGVRVHVDQSGERPIVPCDAAVTCRTGSVLAVLTADCLPVVFVSRDGRRLGLAHAGWRGLVQGVLESTLMALGGNADEFTVWLGPAIRRSAFEVGDEVREAFIAQAPDDAAAFTPNARGRWQADLAWLATQRLLRSGVGHVTDCGLCTYQDAARFYSHRRDPASGRQATLVWRQD